jgi:hypothetical protein
VAGNLENLGKAAKASLNREKADLVASWERFCEDECGVFPASIAAAYLRMTMQGVHAAAKRGWLRWFPVGRVRYYSRRDCVRYRWEVSRKYEDNRSFPKYAPDDPELDARLQRYLDKDKNKQINDARVGYWARKNQGKSEGS